MRPLGLAAVLVASSAAPLVADVRISSTTTVEGGLAGAMGGAMPRVTMQIKGSKARTDVDLGDQTLTGITDLNARQFILLNGAQKTAQISTPDAKPAVEAPPLGTPDVESSLTPTGRTRTVAGVPCEEFTVGMTMSMADVAGPGQVTPQISEMLRGIKLVMNGSMWIAKSGAAAAEFTAFQAAAAKTDMTKLMSAAFGTGSSALDGLMNVFATSGGIPYLTELTLTVGGNEPIAEVLKGHGPMKITTQVTDVSTAALADDVFSVPAGYELIK